MESTIRPYSPADRETVRRICCETGFSGSPVDPLFSDRDVFADFFTRYYTDWEPESCLVVEDQGQVVGYLLGCRRYRIHSLVSLYLLFCIAFKVLVRLLSGRYSASDRAFLWWCCTKGTRETPARPRRSAHLHFNLLPSYRNSMIGYYLFARFCDMVKNAGIKTLYGQIQTYEDRRPLRVFERYGFRLYDQRPVSKFQAFHDRKVYVSTIVRETE